MLGCIQPMSSPMMKRMLGFCCGCCAAAGVFAAITAPDSASRPRQKFLVMLMDLFSIVWLPEMGRQPAPDFDDRVGRLQYRHRNGCAASHLVPTDLRSRCVPAILSLGAVSACCCDAVDARLSSREAASRNHTGCVATRSATGGKEVCVAGAAGVGGAQVQPAS